MGQVISFIFGRLFGRRENIENEKPRPNHEDYSPLPSHYIDIIEQHNYKKKKAEVATNIHRHHLAAAISRQQHQQQQRQKVVSDALVEVEKPRPSHKNYSPLPSHCIDIIEQHNYKKEAAVATNIHGHHLAGNISGQQRKQQQQQRQQKTVWDPLVDVEKPKPTHENYSPLPSHCIDITEQHNYKKKKAEVATNVHRHHLAATISRQQHQQQQRQKVVSDPLVEVEKPRPSHKNYSPLPSHCIDIIEQNNYKKEAAVATNIHRHHLAATISRQQQQQQHQQQKVVSKSLVEVDLHQPLIATNSIVASTACAKKTKQLIIKAATKEATSTKRSESKNKKEILKIGPYVNTQKILLVGEGDFSFSAALAVAFGYAPRIVATSLNNKVFLMKNYKKSMANIENLESRGALVLHDVDATNMANHRSFSGVKFDRIIFNFPHTSSFGRTSSDISQNQKLVRGFLRNAKKMVEEDAGEIHVTHKTSHAYIKWNIVQLGLMEKDLYLIGECPFDPRVFPGYDTKYGHGSDKNFDWFPCKLYKFGLLCQSLI